MFAIIVALCGAIAHVYFAYLETARWAPATVKKIAPTWVERIDDPQLADTHVAWAKRLAFNVGIYNLVLAGGLLWTAVNFINGSQYADILAIYFAVWLLCAAAAALYTQVTKAFIIQGTLGMLLIVAVLL